MDDGFPRYTYDLLVALNAEIPTPMWPATALQATGLDDEAVRRGIWFAAQRALVDTLIDQLIAHEEEQGNEVNREELRPGRAFGRVLPAALSVREASVGGEPAADELDAGPLVPVHHLDSE